MLQKSAPDVNTYAEKMQPALVAISKMYFSKRHEPDGRNTTDFEYIDELMTSVIEEQNPNYRVQVTEAENLLK